MQKNNQQNLISPAAADKLIRAHDGDVALLCIYYLRSGNRDPEQAAAELCRTLGEISAAEEKLMRLGILDAIDEKAAAFPAAPALEGPQYTAADISRRANTDENFAVILSEGEKVFGRKLNSNDMKVLFGIYDYLGLPVEVILMLMNHCAEIYREKYGESRRPSAGAIEREAYEWRHREILTLEQADEYIEFSKNRRSDLESIKRRLDIHDRELTASEKKDIAAWLDMGFNEESIYIAYDRTVNATGSRRWNYMRKIILNWHDMGLHTVDEIEEKDGKRTKAAPTGSSAVKAIDASIIDKI